MTKESLIAYILHLADNNLILAQRNSDWCGHGPVLEQDIAITNISLDLLGQARNFYQYAASLTGNGATEDTLAYLRTEREFKNNLLVELPNGDWAQTILKQYFFSQYQELLYKGLMGSNDEQLAAIAAKGIKETNYHLRWSSEWVIRLGDGTEESHKRMENAINALWSYTGELFQPVDFEIKVTEAGIGPNMQNQKEAWNKEVNKMFDEATLKVPEASFYHTGGKSGIHTEHMGYILADLQYLQRTYPGAEW